MIYEAILIVLVVCGIGAFGVWAAGEAERQYKDRGNKGDEQ